MRILIIDDHPLYREVLRQYVEDYYPDAHVFEAGLVAEAMAVLVEYAAFDLIMLDMALPDMDGLAGLALIRAYAPHLPVVILSGIHDVETARRALAQGANGYVSKSVGGRELKHALRLVRSGGVYISPCVLTSQMLEKPRAVMAASAETMHEEIAEFGMTPRQLEVCCLLLAGLPNKAIARHLACAEGTVRLHVSAVLRALNVSNRTEAVRVALRLGIDVRCAQKPIKV